jgi:biofilm PGA synthesis N-glycosyltransferase PgaC
LPAASDEEQRTTRRAQHFAAPLAEVLAASHPEYASPHPEVVSSQHKADLSSARDVRLDEVAGEATLAPKPRFLRAAPAPGGGMQRALRLEDVPFKGPHHWYVSMRKKFVFALAFAALWVGISLWISLPWIRGAATEMTIVPAVVMVLAIALVPGAFVAFLAASLVLDRQPKIREAYPTTPVTVIIAAYNEAERIGLTLEYLARQDYDGDLEVIVVDNCSTDETAAVSRATAAEQGLHLLSLRENRRGKNHALNTGLAACSTSLLATVDADTLLHPSAVRLLVARYESAPEPIVGVAGAVLVRNSRASLWSRIQEWDYFLGIASVKRMQGMFQSTLVAQGAFSLYNTESVREAGGWPDAIGEDIVLTWKLLKNGGLVYFEPLAVAFTAVPETLRAFARQRSRWARGMIEGLRTVPPWRHGRATSAALTSTNLAIPLVDFAYVFGWLPGLVLACFGKFWIVGPMTAAVLPITCLVYGILYLYQRRRVFQPLGLRVRRNRIALLLFILAYQPIMSLVSVRGYLQEAFRLQRRWR